MRCSITDCSDKPFAKGLCRRHYHEQRTMPCCSVPGCDEPSWARGWCNTHYRRWKTTGTTDDPTRLTDLERYLSKCAPPNANGCRLWTMGCDKDGYGRYQTGIGHGKQVHHRAHRFGYEHLVGPIPEGMLVCHSCDIPGCQSPEHWWLGGHLENQADKHAKGRAVVPRGEGHGASKLTEGQVRAIRRLYATGEITYTALGQLYGVDRGTIGGIVRRENWAWLD